MAAVCDVCGKGPGFGKSVSHSHRRTNRRWNPNIQTKSSKLTSRKEKQTLLPILTVLSKIWQLHMLTLL